MVQVADHLSVAELQAVWRASQDATLARHIRVIWLLAAAVKRGEKLPYEILQEWREGGFL